MKAKIKMAIIVLVVFIVGLGVGILASPYILSRGGFNGANGLGTPPSSASMIGTSFNSSRFAHSAYLISGNATLSSSGQVVTSNFKATQKPLQNGSITYTLTFLESGAAYNITITPAEKLYFIDTSFGDDQGTSDASFGDDGYAVVNSTGYIVQFKYSLSST